MYETGPILTSTLPPPKLLPEACDKEASTVIDVSLNLPTQSGKAFEIIPTVIEGPELLDMLRALTGIVIGIASV